MRHSLRTVLLGTLAALLVGVTTTTLTGSSAAPDAKARAIGDVILVRCDSAGDLSVQAFQGGPSTPAKRSGSCAESLTLLLKEGFVLHNVGHYDEQKAGFVLYTLVR